MLAVRPATPLERQTVGEARDAYRQSCASLGLRPAAELVVEAHASGSGLPLRLYRPLAEADGALPACLLYLHGGGWVIGDLDTHDGICRTLALRSGCLVVSLDYPLAPEHPFPAAIEGVVETIGWLRDAAPALGFDPLRFAIGGDSAGANLATVACLLLREAGEPMPVLQLLFYPATDLRAGSGSYARVTEGVLLTAARSRWFLQHYLSEPGQTQDWRASPLLAPSLAGLPPAWILTVGHDPLRDEGTAYAKRLEEAGVVIAHLHLSDQIHGLLTLGRALPQAAVVLEQASQALRRFTDASRGAVLGA
nr:alpha/beta hydrolase [uncultured Lichenicoccus sp.]